MGTTVTDVMTTRVIAVRRDADFKQIAEVLRRYRISACPVIDDAGRVAGVVSEADLLYKADASVQVPARVMRDRRLKRLPVVSHNGELIGIISQADVLGVYDRPDADILAEVARVVASELATIPDGFEATVSSGVVTLTGSVACQETALELAARIRHVEGVVAVRDRLAVGQLID